MQTLEYEPLCKQMPLQPEYCQRMHYEALLTASRGVYTAAWPMQKDLSLLRQQAKQIGREAYLSSPEEIAQIFRGVTLSTYQFIDQLYCNRLERSVHTIWRILHAQACQKNTTPVSYEAIWAICAHLRKRRQQRTALTVDSSTDTWIMTHHSLQDDGSPGAQTGHLPRFLVCVANRASQHILAFRTFPHRTGEQEPALVLYDALIQQRSPAPHTRTGLSWHLPQRLISSSGVSLQGTLDCCEQLGIQVEEEQTPPSFLTHQVSAWNDEAISRQVRADRWEAGFDSFLHKQHGYSPRRRQEHLDQAFSCLSGYQRDPAWQCAPLRSLLPANVSSVTSDGLILHEGLAYTDDLLPYWPGTPVMVRVLPQTRDHLWVYLDSEILCQATADLLKPNVHLRDERKVRT